MCKLPIRLYLGCGCSLSLGDCQFCSNCREDCFSYGHVEYDNGLCPIATEAISSGTELGSCQLGCIFPRDPSVRLARMRQAAAQEHWATWDNLGLKLLVHEEENIRMADDVVGVTSSDSWGYFGLFENLNGKQEWLSFW
jgi:hypothetical protein